MNSDNLTSHLASESPGVLCMVYTKGMAVNFDSILFINVFL